MGRTNYLWNAISRHATSVQVPDRASDGFVVSARLGDNHVASDRIDEVKTPVEAPAPRPNPFQAAHLRSQDSVSLDDRREDCRANSVEKVPFADQLGQDARERGFRQGRQHWEVSVETTSVTRTAVPPGATRWLKRRKWPKR